MQPPSLECNPWQSSCSKPSAISTRSEQSIRESLSSQRPAPRSGWGFHGQHHAQLSRIRCLGGWLGPKCNHTPTVQAANRNQSPRALASDRAREECEVQVLELFQLHVPHQSSILCSAQDQTGGFIVLRHIRAVQQHTRLCELRQQCLLDLLPIATEFAITSPSTRHSPPSHGAQGWPVGLTAQSRQGVGAHGKPFVSGNVGRRRNLGTCSRPCSFSHLHFLAVVL
mmetsp:Transcript_71233/g.191846  ORF Transcript_71233/g.191846 Transcript_71233/m.191846 type:complete len:226 (+) Transcript_71233:645-1322(+)